MCEACHIRTKGNGRESIHLWKDRQENEDSVASGERGDEVRGRLTFYCMYFFLTFELFIVYYSFKVCIMYSLKRQNFLNAKIL